VKPSAANIVSAAESAQIGIVAVAEYRLYCLDGANKVSSGDWIEAADDEAAVEIAKETHEGYECELWQGKRLVAQLDLRRQA
jgi:hypothetical protein